MTTRLAWSSCGPRGLSNLKIYKSLAPLRFLQSPTLPSTANMPTTTSPPSSFASARDTYSIAFDGLKSSVVTVGVAESSEARKATIDVCVGRLVSSRHPLSSSSLTTMPQVAFEGTLQGFSQSGLPWLSLSAEDPLDWIPTLRGRLPFPGLPQLIASIRRVSNTIAELAVLDNDGDAEGPSTIPSSAISGSNELSSSDAPAASEILPKAGSGASKGKATATIKETLDDIEDETDPPLALARQVLAAQKGRALLVEKGLELCREMVSSSPLALSFSR